MKKAIIFILILCSSLFTLHAAAQWGCSCLPEGITFSTQAQIDSFGTNYPGCIEIEGDLIISGDNITNLDGLSMLTSIGGYLFVAQNYTLASLTGLDNVASIGGRLEIWWNDSLTSLTGLEGLTSIGGNLQISDNYALTNLTGLDNVTSIGDGLLIQYNYDLTSLMGLDNLTSIGGYLFVAHNHTLASLTGLDNLISIEGGLIIERNDDLTSLTGLEGLTSIGGELYVGYNASLTTLTGLDNLTSIGGGLGIGNNDVLTSLTGLDNIEANTISDLYIFENPSLFNCDVQSICDYLVVPNGTVNIFDNATGCDSQQEVEEACGILELDERDVANLCVIYPNPIAGKTTFSVTLDEPTQVNLLVMDSFGRIVAKVVNQSMSNGNHQITWNAQGLPSGIYFYRLTTGSQSSTGKLVVVR